MITLALVLRHSIKNCSIELIELTPGERKLRKYRSTILVYIGQLGAALIHQYHKIKTKVNTLANHHRDRTYNKPIRTQHQAPSTKRGKAFSEILQASSEELCHEGIDVFVSVLPQIKTKYPCHNQITFNRIISNGTAVLFQGITVLKEKTLQI